MSNERELLGLPYEVMEGRPNIVRTKNDASIGSDIQYAACCGGDNEERSTNEERAAYIVRACNAHHGLVEALKQLRSAEYTIIGCAHQPSLGDNCLCRECIEERADDILKDLSVAKEPTE